MVLIMYLLAKTLIVNSLWQLTHWERPHYPTHPNAPDRTTGTADSFEDWHAYQQKIVQSKNLTAKVPRQIAVRFN